MPRSSKTLGRLFDGPGDGSARLEPVVRREKTDLFNQKTNRGKIGRSNQRAKVELLNGCVRTYVCDEVV